MRRSLLLGELTAEERATGSASTLERFIALSNEKLEFPGAASIMDHFIPPGSGSHVIHTKTLNLTSFKPRVAHTKTLNLRSTDQGARDIVGERNFILVESSQVPKPAGSIDRAPRAALELTDSTREIADKMSENNPGAIRVLIEILKTPHGFFDVLHLDDMNIRGPQIWAAYKYFAHENINVLIKGLETRDPQLVSVVNDTMGEKYPHRAVTGGAGR